MKNGLSQLLQNNQTMIGPESMLELAGLAANKLRLNGVTVNLIPLGAFSAQLHRFNLGRPFLLAAIWLAAAMSLGAASGGGLKGEYCDDAEFVRLRLTRTDATINFTWDTK